MTYEEIGRLYPEAEFFKASRKYVIDGQSYSCRLRIKQFRLGDTKLDTWLLDVYFLMDNKNGLAAIQMEDTLWYDGKADFDAISKLLTKKYSPPFDSKNIAANSIYYTERKYACWKTANAKLTLLSLSIPDQGLYRISITYQKP